MFQSVVMTLISPLTRWLYEIAYIEDNDSSVWLL